MCVRFFATRRNLGKALGYAAAAMMAACSASGDSRRGPIAGGSDPIRACTLIGCEDGLTVTLEAPGAWLEGRYVFEIQTDDVHVTCRGSLPVPSCTAGAPPSRSVVCDRVGVVQIVESGCALPRASEDSPEPTPTLTPAPSPVAPPVTHAFPAVVFDRALRPQNVEIAVSWNGRLVGRAAFSPRFERLQPNGPDCPPVCHSARSTVTLGF